MLSVTPRGGCGGRDGCCPRYLPRDRRPSLLFLFASVRKTLAEDGGHAPLTIAGPFRFQGGPGALVRFIFHGKFPPPQESCYLGLTGEPFSCCSLALRRRAAVTPFSHHSRSGSAISTSSASDSASTGTAERLSEILAAPDGLAPSLPDPKSGVLLLDDRAVGVWTQR